MIDPVKTALDAGAAYINEAHHRIFLMSAYELQKFVLLLSSQIENARQASDIVPNR